MRPGYFVGRALSGMRSAPFVHGVAALTIAVALTLGACAVAVGLQARELLAHWGLRAEITLYLDLAVPDDEGVRLAALAAERSGGDARFVTPAAALERLALSLGEDGEVLRALPGNPLPPSIDVVPAGAPSAAEVAALAAGLSGLPGVVEVDYGRTWIDRVTALARAVRVVGLIVLPLVLLGAAVLAGSVVRLAVYARRDEIEILKLVGATDAFVRTPFLIEGTLAGLAGGALAAAALLGIARRVGPELAALAGGIPVASPVHLAAVVAAGAVLGLVASAFSVGRHLGST